ncbi:MULTISPECIES: DUF438 domain-containing protein [Marinilabiliaceae]|uniref:DUF438 domain-containing protein n=1 Tax=Plebeiibacterium sediminum TaxID=2992112 RepID=A0AAE3M8J7_9BACT|nr:DUF438 domain-containing protein [Plebeiobacterium sediminum]MCU4165738.1 DUF438 domain-containing protein [Marinilabiliaceae bacterium A049]MCW3788976.1 DUF438 domain-containing protein [Plebeiobacterium sediminum]
MSELINNSKYRKERLKELILKLHQGESAEAVKKELVETLKNIPYGEVVEVEQELMQEGLPEEEVLKLCDVHGSVLEGNVDLTGAKDIPAGHPVDVFKNENIELKKVAEKSKTLLKALSAVDDSEFQQFIFGLQGVFNQLMDVDKHYLRKEYLVFPHLEKNEITGPPKVMWGKHDEIREQLKGCIEVLNSKDITKTDLVDSLDLLFFPTLQAVVDMVQKEEEILFPMSMDVLTTEDWWSIHKQTLEFGFCLYDPQVEWKPEGLTDDKDETGVSSDGSIQLPSGSFSAKEIMAILNSVPFDMTFVDKNDKVKYFTQGKERIFVRNRSIINRDVRLCHPPGSTHIVEKILEDFKSGKASHAPFWIQMKGKFIKIEYFALRGEDGEYLGTLEVSQDLSENRALEGERRILEYTDNKESNNG